MRLKTRNELKKQTLQSLKPYNSEFGFMLKNLFGVVENQFEKIYECLDEVGLSETDKERLLPYIWQTESIVQCIKSKVPEKLFIDIEDLIYFIKEDKANN